MSQWQPIKTAPKDGVVLGYFPHERPHKKIVVMQTKGGRPFIAGGVFAFDLTPPTHWMQLPAAPEQSS